jgi:uncharacterized protein YbjT (DUF2867 family)
VPETILVIGSLGNVGAQVIKSLLERCQSGSDIHIRAADPNPVKIASQFGPVVESVAFDFTRPETFAPALNGVSRMFLLRPPQIANVQKTLLPALKVARSEGVRQVVFLSLIGVQNAPIVPHYKVEQDLLRHGPPYTFLRPSFFMQNLNTTHRDEIRLNDEINVPVGKARTSFVDTRDLGAVAALTLTQPGHDYQAYELTGSEALDYYQVAERFSAALGRKIVYRDPSPLTYILAARRRGLAWPFALVTVGLYISTRFGMADKVTGEVERLLGRPPITFDQYIHDYRQSWER